MVHQYTCDKETGNMKPDRFPIYWSLDFEWTEEDWIKDVQRVSYIWLCGMSQALKKPPLNKHKRWFIYCYVYLNTKKSIDQTGQLIVNHILELASVLGLLPI